MARIARDDIEISSIYATCWRMIYMGVHRYDSRPAGELLTVMTIAVLDKAGYAPTVSELADLTGLAKSNVSRYVSRQINGGYIEEFVDREDRRRRRLRPTKMGSREAKWNQSNSLALARKTREAFSGSSDGSSPAENLKTVLLSMTEGSAGTN
jgi:DNA-binding MarR family transcriptional regulator